MNTPANQYKPDYAVPPGWILEEYLETRSISQAEFARRCGRSSKHISEIIAGKAPLTPVTALQFEKVLGLDATVWLGVEADYRLHKVQNAEADRATAHIAWSQSFPVKELAHRLGVEEPSSDLEAIPRLLAFFGVASVDAWQTEYGAMSVAYRHSPSFQSDPAVLATWLRLGELSAVEQDCGQFNRTEFRRALRRIRELTQQPFDTALAEATNLCSVTGVALVCVKPLSKMAVSGAARWLSPRKALIQLSARHKSDDHFWFSFFHEAAHILLHSKKHIYVDSNRGKNTDSEAEADQWASDFLIPPTQWEQFSLTPRFSNVAVRRLAADLGIAPGIVVGRLQHEKLIPWQNLNGLKVQLEWQDED